MDTNEEEREKGKTVEVRFEAYISTFIVSPKESKLQGCLDSHHF